MKSFINGIAAVGFLSMAVSAHAVTIQSIDFQPISGTTLSDVLSPGGAAYDFGGYGTGRLRFESVAPGPINALIRITPSYSATLDNGNQFLGSTEIVFNLVGNSSFVIRATLDAGALFPTGSLFEIRSLDRIGASAQYFLPGAGLGAVYSQQLPSDGSAQLVADSAGEFSAVGNANDLAVSLGRAWDVGGVNSFSGTFRQDMTFGGVAITIATPLVTPIPEPGSLALMATALGTLVALRQRRKRAVAA
jgi:PEP-CTERM motif